jgi:hypothetical protein
LLPTLTPQTGEADAFDPSARPTLLELVMQPPPLPAVQ